MKKISAVMFVLGLMALLSGKAFAAEASVQQILDLMTQSPYHDSSVDVATEKVADDDYWAITGEKSLASMIVELAGYKDLNSFGVYDAKNFNNRVQIFAGQANAGQLASVSIMADGSVWVNNKDTHADFASGSDFGFYMNSPQGVFYSDTSLNTDAYDHMWAFQGEGDMVKLPGVYNPFVWTPDKYVLAWEDVLGSSADGDHNDMVLMISCIAPVPVRPVPEPGTLILLGAGMAGLALYRRRRKY